MTDRELLELAAKAGIRLQSIAVGPGELHTLTLDMGVTPTAFYEAFYKAARNEALEAAKRECDRLRYSGEVGPILCLNAIESLKERK